MFAAKIASLGVALLAAVSVINAETLVTTVSFAEGDFTFSTREGGGETFDYIDLPGQLHLNTPGAPMLPLVATAFAVPWGSTINNINVTVNSFVA